MKKWGSLLLVIAMLFTAVPTAFGAVRTGWDLKSPRGIATDSSGRIYVADIGNHRIQVFNENESLSMTLGETGIRGADNAHLDTPTTVAVDAATGEIYVTDTSNKRIQVYSSQGSYLRSLALPASAVSESVALDGLGHVFVTDHNNMIYRFNTDGSGYKQLFGYPDVDYRPLGIAADSKGTLYISQVLRNTIVVYTYNKSQDKYTYQKTIGEKDKPGTDNMHFNQPWGAHVDRDDRLYIADGGNKRVQVYNSDGSYHMTLTAPSLTSPYHVATDRNGTIYVSDNHRSILMFDAQGQFVKTLGQNTVPVFEGSQTALAVAQDSSPTDVRSLLKVTDSDSGQTLSWTLTTAPTHGAVSLGQGVAASGGSGLTPADAIEYEPAAGYFGTDPFTVTVSDGAGGSAARTINVTVSRKAAAPTADPASGSVVADGSGIALSTTTPGASIYYTTDGTEPTTASAAGTAVAVSGAPGETVTVKAFAAGPNLLDSDVVTFSYVIETPKSSNADLQSLSLSAGDLSPAFSSGTTRYSASVASEISSLTVTPSVADAVYGTVAVSVYDGTGKLTGGPHALSGGEPRPRCLWRQATTSSRSG